MRGTCPWRSRPRPSDCPEVERELAVLFVVGRVEAVVVEVVERYLDAVELEGQSRVATSDCDNAVRGMLEFPQGVVEGMRRLRSRHLSNVGH
jgi:hypothetical protein